MFIHDTLRWKVLPLIYSTINQLFKMWHVFSVNVLRTETSFWYLWTMLGLSTYLLCPSDYGWLVHLGSLSDKLTDQKIKYWHLKALICAGCGVRPPLQVTISTCLWLRREFDHSFLPYITCVHVYQDCLRTIVAVLVFQELSKLSVCGFEWERAVLFP